MPKPNPKAWFPGKLVRIAYRPVDKWAVHNQKFRPYFSTWSDAHAWMLARAKERLKLAQAELKKAERNLAQVKMMRDPTNG